jgi:hypothetical protein
VHIDEYATTPPADRAFVSGSRSASFIRISITFARREPSRGLPDAGSSGHTSSGL